MSTPENRKSARMRSLIGARAMFNDGRSGFDCQIKNQSATGAKLELESTLGLPSEFVLEIPSRGTKQRVRVCWRVATTVGIEFI
jgi:hypothetical protein